MKKENIPNALTLIRVVMIPIFIAILSLSHSYLGHIVAAVILQLQVLQIIGWLSSTKMECG